MRVVIQRVSEASVKVEEKMVGKIGSGLLVLAGFEEDDTKEDFDWITQKIIGLRIFPDENGVMNISVKEVSGGILIVSQFTLHASTKKGNRPSYIKAAKPDLAKQLYSDFLKVFETAFGSEVQKGIFGADMKVSLINDGPVTIIIDSRLRE